MVINNFRLLCATELRADALRIAEAGYEAVDIASIFTDRLTRAGDALMVGADSYDLGRYRNIYVLGVGKGSALAAKAVERIVGVERIAAGVVIDTVTEPLHKVASYQGSHPLPSEANIEATRKLVEIATSADADDLVIALICGGGSSLLCQPHERTCLEVKLIANFLLKAGASIREINTVRKHLSEVHGGGLAKYAHPATVLSLVLSDVPGDELDMVASGPTSLDTTTVADAQEVAKKFGLPSDISMLETPKDPEIFKRVHTYMLASGSMAVEAMAAKAKELGYEVAAAHTQFAGPAKDAGKRLIADLRPGSVVLACGETEVTVTKPGKGGRNQDVVLASVPYLEKDMVIISAASDGKDNLPVAGGIADGEVTVSALATRGINAAEAVENNQSYAVLHELGDHLLTNPGTANISDFIVVLQAKQPPTK